MVALTLPAGFCATVFADNIGHARHVAVADNGTVYVNTWKRGVPPPKGSFIVALRDTNGDGRADIVKRFGRNPATGLDSVAGTGIAIYKGYVYAEEGPTINRYRLRSDSITPDPKKEVVVSGLALDGSHSMHPFVIDAAGALYVNFGAATNSCQLKDRMLESPGQKPCTELEKRVAESAVRCKQAQSVEFTRATIRNGNSQRSGIAIEPNGSLYSTQHGRDQLAESWPKLYSAEQGQNLPAEELLKIRHRGDYGWPWCYFDNVQKKLVLAPEYGGDGGKALENAHRNSDRSHSFLRTGRLTVCSFIQEPHSPGTIAGRASSHFMDRGIAHPGRKVVIR